MRTALLCVLQTAVWLPSLDTCNVCTDVNACDCTKGLYGVVPKDLLTFRGSLYKEVAKTTPGTLVYHFERNC